MFCPVCLHGYIHKADSFHNVITIIFSRCLCPDLLLLASFGAELYDMTVQTVNNRIHTRLSSTNGSGTNWILEKIRIGPFKLQRKSRM